MRYRMHMPLSIAMASLALIAAPLSAESHASAKSPASAAGEAASSEKQMIEMADKMGDDDMQNSIAGMVERMAAMMMKLPVGEFAAAIEEARPGSVKNPIPKDASLADLAGDDAQHIPEKMGEQSRMAMNMMSGFARVFAKMMPEFEDMARDMADEMTDEMTADFGAMKEAHSESGT